MFTKNNKFFKPYGLNRPNYTAIIYSHFIFLCLMSLYTEKTSGYYYIGLHKEKGIWKWADGSSVNYTNWDKNEPQKSPDPSEDYDSAGISFEMDGKLKWHSFIGNFHCNDGTFCQKKARL